MDPVGPINLCTDSFCFRDFITTDFASDRPR